jgi:hypothetical protein
MRVNGQLEGDAIHRPTRNKSVNEGQIRRWPVVYKGKTGPWIVQFASRSNSSLS